MALGTVFSGLTHSPAAMAVASTPTKEKPATIKILKMAKPPPTKGASPTVQFSNPTVSELKIPKIIKTPMTRKIIIVRTLIPANQNSASPKIPAENRFKTSSRIIDIALHITDELSGNQNFITMADATSSVASVIALQYQ